MSFSKILFQWKFKVSTFVVKHKFDALQECLDEGIHHFIKSLNRLENHLNDNQKQFNCQNIDTNKENSSTNQT